MASEEIQRDCGVTINNLVLIYYVYDFVLLNRYNNESTNLNHWRLITCDLVLLSMIKDN